MLYIYIVVQKINLYHSLIITVQLFNSDRILNQQDFQGNFFKSKLRVSIEIFLTHLHAITSIAHCDKNIFINLEMMPYKYFSAF